MKTETVEGEAEKYANNWEEIHPELDPENMTPIEVSKIDFIAGAKWQQEKETIEDLEKAFNAGSAFATGSHKDFKQTHPDFKEWFEQFKNKKS